MKREFHLMELLATDTEIPWWNDIRERINKTINVFNDWQRNGFDEWEAGVTRAEILLLIETLEKTPGVSDWHTDTAREMLNHVTYCMQEVSE